MRGRWVLQPIGTRMRLPPEPGRNNLLVCEWAPRLQPGWRCWTPGRRGQWNTPFDRVWIHDTLNGRSHAGPQEELFYRVATHTGLPDWKEIVVYGPVQSSRQGATMNALIRNIGPFRLPANLCDPYVVPERWLQDIPVEQRKGRKQYGPVRDFGHVFQWNVYPATDSEAYYILCGILRAIALRRFSSTRTPALRKMLMRRSDGRFHEGIGSRRPWNAYCSDTVSAEEWSWRLGPRVAIIDETRHVENSPFWFSLGGQVIPVDAPGLSKLPDTFLDLADRHIILGVPTTPQGVHYLRKVCKRKGVCWNATSGVEILFYRWIRQHLPPTGALDLWKRIYQYYLSDEGLLATTPVRPFLSLLTQTKSWSVDPDPASYHLKRKGSADSNPAASAS